MAPIDITIREETPADVAAIEAVTSFAFLNAPHTRHTEQFIIRALREAGRLEISLVADANGRVVGHVAISPVAISGGAPGWFGLGPVSVMPEHQGHGIGSRLVREAARRLRNRGGAGCVVVGEPAYYERFGFRSAPDLVYPGVPSEHFLVLPFGSTSPRGIVSYHDAFSAQG